MRRLQKNKIQFIVYEISEVFLRFFISHNNITPATLLLQIISKQHLFRVINSRKLFYKIYARLIVQYN